MDRLTDSKVASELKSNYEGLQRLGIEPSVMSLRYVRLAELEDNELLYKVLLRHAMLDLEDAEDCDSCIYDSECCPGVTGDCKFKWKHHDEAMQLLGEEKE